MATCYTHVKAAVDKNLLAIYGIANYNFWETGIATFHKECSTWTAGALECTHWVSELGPQKLTNWNLNSYIHIGQMGGQYTR